MNELFHALRSIDRNIVALLLSVVPGAGHLYKHHYAEGFGILIGGNLLVAFAAVLLSLATLGVSLVLLPAAYLLIVAMAAYYAPDWHGRHHFLHPWSPEVKD